MTMTFEQATTFTADKNTVNTLNYAYYLAKQTGYAGITLDGTIVATGECVGHQERCNNLVLKLIKMADNAIRIIYLGEFYNDMP